MRANMALTASSSQKLLTPNRNDLRAVPSAMTEANQNAAFLETNPFVALVVSIWDGGPIMMREHSNNVERGKASPLIGSPSIGFFAG
jgi:hypothetical protein